MVHFMIFMVIMNLTLIKLIHNSKLANEDLDINTQHQLRNRLIKNDDYTYRKDVIISWERLTETPG